MKDQDDDSFAWNAALETDFTPPLHFIFPLKDKLGDPEHKRRSRSTTIARRKAKRNLDDFW